MQTHVDHENRLIAIWLSGGEGSPANLRPFYEAYRDTSYRVVVFRSGTGDLLANTSALLRHNRG